jgi:ApaG protein
MDNECKDNSSASTNGVLVTVQARYVPARSLPLARRYVFVYTVRIRNEGQRAVQLRTRHWIIVDSTGAKEEVQGEGVVGEQPVIQPGSTYEYVSAALLKTPRGTMRGSYRMTTWSGKSFDAVIAPFLLAMPFSTN